MFNKENEFDHQHISCIRRHWCHSLYLMLIVYAETSSILYNAEKAHPHSLNPYHVWQAQHHVSKHKQLSFPSFSSYSKIAQQKKKKKEKTKKFFCLILKGFSLKEFLKLRHYVLVVVRCQLLISLAGFDKVRRFIWIIYFLASIGRFKTS